jgi:hypothetical protein
MDKSKKIGSARSAPFGVLFSVLLCLSTLSANTIAHWQFNEGPLGSDVPAAENQVLDASGNGNHLRTWSAGTSPTYLNDTSFDPLPLTGEGNVLALNFTPNRDLYTEGKPINSHLFNAWTIEASFKAHVTSRWQVVVGKDGNPASAPPPLSLKLLATDGRLEMGLVDGSGQWRTVLSQQPLQAGVWYSAAGTATSTEMALWLKGPAGAAYVLQGTAGISGAFRDYNGLNRTWTIGRGMWNGNITDWFDGVIDQVRISDVALEPSRFLAAPRPLTSPADLRARAALAERMEGGERVEYLALESAPLDGVETFLLEASQNLVNWEQSEFTLQAIEEESGERVRLVSEIRPDEHDAYFLRARVQPPGPGRVPQNPVVPGADPDVLLIGDTVWLYPTYRAGERRFFAFSSTDLVTWRIHGPILRFADVGWIPAGKQAWAPGVAEKNGSFYLYYSVGPKPSYIGVAMADSPAGPFIDSGAPLLFDDGDPGFEAIDAMVFTDPASGQSYLYAGGSAGATLRVFELNPDMISFAREVTVTTPLNFTEGAFMHYRGGVYYLSYSHGYWGDQTYSVHYSTSTTPVGPWIYRGELLSSDSSHKGPGHHSILHNPHADEWYMIYHRWNDRSGPGPYDGRRKVAIDLLKYDEAGLIKPVVMSQTGVGPIRLGPLEETVP